MQNNIDNSYFIAEVGQNHQGDVKLALEYIKVFADAGADCIKFQKRNNRVLFDKSAYEKEYNSENSFGTTYGEHREHLELSDNEMKDVKLACEDHGVDFMCTPFDEPSLDFLVKIQTKKIKIASFDIGNIPFLKLVGETMIPVTMSVGGGKKDQIKSSISEIKKYHSDLTLLHCVSEYPCPPEHLGLNEISRLIEIYPELTIGSSDHFNGILSGPIAYMLGARVFEKHVTLNRSNKGTDHSFALEAEGFKKFVRDVRRTPIMLAPKDTSEIGKEPVFKKLGKSICASVPIKAGTVITADMLTGIIFEDNGIPVRRSNEIIGSVAKHDFSKGEKIVT